MFVEIILPVYDAKYNLFQLKLARWWVSHVKESSKRQFKTATANLIW
jgi:hypothetical protein